MREYHCAALYPFDIILESIIWLKVQNVRAKYDAWF